MKIVVRPEAAQELIELAGGRKEDVAGKTGLSFTTVRNMERGDPVAGGTIAALWTLKPTASFDELFMAKERLEEKTEVTG